MTMLSFTITADPPVEIGRTRLSVLLGSWVSRTKGRRSAARQADAKLGAIQACPAFVACDTQQLLTLGAETELVTIAAGRTVPEAADPYHWWWIALEGSLSYPPPDRETGLRTSRPA